MSVRCLPNSGKRAFSSFRQFLLYLILACLASSVFTLPLYAAPNVPQRNEGGAHALPSENHEARACAQIGMSVVASPPGADGLFCAPHGNSAPSKITACLKIGMEAVLIPEWAGVVCATPMKGGDFLDGNEAAPGKSKQYAHPHKVNVREICEAQTDRRILGRDIIKKLVRQAAQEIDPAGMRIIGGIFCSGLDLNGVDIPYSLVLDRSIVTGTDGQIDIRNFRTRGDLSLDNTVVYTSVRIRRSEISGSLYAQRAFFNKLEIGDSTVKGSIKLDHSFIVETLNLENISVDGDLDISSSYFSALEILKARVDGVLDLSRTQARCTYDIRKNSIGDMIAVQLGFGAANLSKKGETKDPYTFKAISNNSAFGRPAFLSNNKPDPDQYDRFSDPAAANGTAPLVQSSSRCPNSRALRAGTFLVVDNDIKASLCIRSFNWFTHQADVNKTLKSNIYLNEDAIEGAAWLDFAPPQRPDNRPAQEFAGAIKPDVSIFNVKAGTLVLNFGFAAFQGATLNVSGLHFEHIYGSQADCETALSIRSSRDLRASGKSAAGGAESSADPINFPPRLRLPDTNQVIAWINKNSFSDTQQPFAEFVRVFEREGNSEAARNLRISAADAAFQANICGLFPSFLRNGGPCRLPNQSDQGEKTTPERYAFAQIFIDALHWLEKAIVVLIDAVLWRLADHGYRPERIGWFVLGTLLIFMLMLFPFWLGIVGYSVKSRPDKVKLIGLVFLFDRLLPAYRLREENYEVAHYYVLPKKGESRNCAMLNFRQFSWIVAEANERETERAQKWLDVLRFLGLVFTIFIIAAISRLVR